MQTFHRHAASAVAILFACAMLGGATRPAAAIPYKGTPDLKLTVDMVTAGSDKNGFDTKVLFAQMYGDGMPTEAARLTHIYGTGPVTNFFDLMNYTVADVLRMVKRDKVPLPPADNPIEPQQFDKNLVAAGMVHAGRRGGHYDVGYMIEHLITHKYHHELMMDLYHKYPRNEVASFHSVLASVVKDTPMNARVPSRAPTPSPSLPAAASPGPTASSAPTAGRMQSSPRPSQSPRP